MPLRAYTPSTFDEPCSCPRAMPASPLSDVEKTRISLVALAAPVPKSGLEWLVEATREVVHAQRITSYSRALAELAVTGSHAYDTLVGHFQRGAWGKVDEWEDGTHARELVARSGAAPTEANTALAFEIISHVAAVARYLVL